MIIGLLVRKIRKALLPRIVTLLNYTVSGIKRVYTWIPKKVVLQL